MPIYGVTHAQAQLSIIVVSPGPKRSVGSDTHTVPTSGRHHDPIRGRAHPGRGMSISGMTQAQLAGIIPSPTPERPVGSHAQTVK